MVITVSVKHNIIKHLCEKLVENKITFEMNTAHGSFRMHNVTQWLYLSNTECFAISFTNYFLDSGIHKDNILELCISDK